MDITLETRRLRKYEKSDLDKYLHEIHRKESEGIRRNEQFLKELSRASRSANMLNEKTEKLQEIRQNYQMYLSKVYPKWKEKLRQSGSSHEERNRAGTSRNRNLKRTQNYETEELSRKPYYEEESARTSRNPNLKQTQNYESEEFSQKPYYEKESTPYNSFIQNKMERWKRTKEIYSSNEEQFKQYQEETMKMIRKLEKNLKENQKLQNELNQTKGDPDKFENFLKKRETLLPPPFPSTKAKLGFSQTSETYKTFDESNVSLPISYESPFSQNQNFHWNKQDKKFSHSSEFHHYQHQFLQSPPTMRNNNIPIDNVQVIPQLLALSPEGKLVLLPMASPLNTYDNYNKPYSSPESKNPQEIVKQNESIGTRGSSEQIGADLNPVNPCQSPKAKNVQDTYVESEPVELRKSHTVDINARNHPQDIVSYDNENQLQSTNKENGSFASVSNSVESDFLNEMGTLPKEKLERQRVDDGVKKTLYQKLHLREKVNHENSKKSPKSVQEELFHESILTDISQGRTYQNNASDNLEKDITTIKSQVREQKMLQLGNRDSTSDLQAKNASENFDSIEESSSSVESKIRVNENLDLENLENKSGITEKTEMLGGNSLSLSLTNSKRPKNNEILKERENHVSANTNAEESFDESIVNFSDDISDFDLPSNNDEATQKPGDSVENEKQEKTKIDTDVAKTSQNIFEESIKLPLSFSEGVDSDKHLEHSEFSIGKETIFNEDVLSYLVDKMNEKILKESEEAIILNSPTELELCNEIMKAIEIEEDLSQYSPSKLNMAYRHYLQEYTINEDSDCFLIGEIDEEIDFEGDLRDHVTPSYLHIWDDLYAFLSNVMDNFDFEASQVARVYSDVLIPNDKLLKEKLNIVLTNILTTPTTMGEYLENQEEYHPKKDETNDVKMDSELSTKPKSVSITEEFTMKNEAVNIEENKDDPEKQTESESTFHLPDLKSKKSADLKDNQLNESLGSFQDPAQRSLSLNVGSVSDDFGDDNDDSSSMSFDSEGMPVKKSKSESGRVSGDVKLDDVETKESKALNTSLVNSETYRKFSRESLISPVHEDSDDDINDLLGESIGLKSTKTNIEDKSLREQSEKSMSNEGLSTQRKSSLKLNLSKPAFWEDSDSDPDIGNDKQNVAGKAEDNDEDDFDFDFYD